MRRHLVEAGGLGLVAALHKDVEAGQGSGGSGRDLAAPQIKLGVVGGHEVRGVAVALVAEGLARVGGAWRGGPILSLHAGHVCQGGEGSGEAKGEGGTVNTQELELWG